VGNGELDQKNSDFATLVPLFSPIQPRPITLLLIQLIALEVINTSRMEY